SRPSSVQVHTAQSITHSRHSAISNLPIFNRLHTPQGGGVRPSRHGVANLRPPQQNWPPSTPGEKMRALRFRFAISIAAVLLATTASAQDTPTEKDAARDIVRQIRELSTTLGVDAMVARLTDKDEQRDIVIARVTDLMKTDLLPM